MSWPSTTLDAIASTDDLHVAPFREDGTTYGTPTWIWSVVTGGALYVRAYNGSSSRWYQAALSQHAGRVSAAGDQHEVTFTHADDGVLASVDEAYRAKYAGSPYLDHMVTGGARQATVQVAPR